MRRKLAAGNWKMHGLLADLSQISALNADHPDPATDILICPPTTLIVPACAASNGGAVQIGAQDCHARASGAFTGDLSAVMLKDAGATAVIVGHSERRDAHEESSEDVRAKSKAAHAAGLTAIICLGESLAQREAANTLDIIAGQLSISVPDTAVAANTVIAYEPCWAIGSGLTPTPAQIGEVHDFIRARLTTRFGEAEANGMRLLYGGSVKPGNAAEIFEVSNVDGALVGGASLKAEDFTPIINALKAAS
ncbi:triose-phosphate isomerase [Pseudohalocynthiibacter aestuariivivens]|nr:triose-phosphate isomerase [Pseudohalocynthiibacter aestuariivivens]QIE44526.1 triose-phosphate isomerase [Pseudohalocynthiibacter aestuariivivens]